MVRKTTKHYIAYLDILGYKDFLKNKPEQSEQYLQTILDAVEKVKHNVSAFQNTTNMFHINGELKLKIFSDNIVLCLPVGEGSDEVRRAIVFLLEVASIQRGLIIEHGLLVRGGIATGDLFINEDMVFGQGLIDAVDLEAQAEFPCIVASEETQQSLFRLLHSVKNEYQRVKEIAQKEKRQEPLTKEEKQFLSEHLAEVALALYHTRSLGELLKRFDKETVFLNYLFDMSFSNLFGTGFAEYLNQAAAKDPKKYESIVGTVENYPAILLAHREMVIQRVQDYCHYRDVDKTDQTAVLQREKVIRKYVWLLRYHISMCRQRKFEPGLFSFKFNCDKNVLRQIVEIEDQKS